MDEWQGLMVFAPDQPNIFLLNRNSWLILELCNEGTTREELSRAYREVVGDKIAEEEVERNIEEGLELLKQRGLVEVGSEANSTTP